MRKKELSFRSNVVTGSAIESDSEADCIDESAIDDDDESSDWEDSIEDSGKSGVDETSFQRVDCKSNSTSRCSLITQTLARQADDGDKNLGNYASQSTPAIHRQKPGPSAPTLGVSLNDSDDAPLMMKGR